MSHQTLNKCRNYIAIDFPDTERMPQHVRRNMQNLMFVT